MTDQEERKFPETFIGYQKTPAEESTTFPIHAPWESDTPHQLTDNEDEQLNRTHTLSFSLVKFPRSPSSFIPL